MADYDTELTPTEQSVYDTKFSQQDSADYDMQGWFKDNYEPGIGGIGITLPDHEGHYVDTYKKPNHITFSDESMYHGVDGNQGGSWTTTADGSFAFRPGATNFENHSTQDMIDYFNQNEPGNYLLLGGESNQVPVESRSAEFRKEAEPPYDFLETLGKHADFNKITEFSTNLSLRPLIDPHGLLIDQLNAIAKEVEQARSSKASDEVFTEINKRYAPLAKRWNEQLDKEDEANDEYHQRGKDFMNRITLPSKLAIDGGIDNIPGSKIDVLPRNKPK